MQIADAESDGQFGLIGYFPLSWKMDTLSAIAQPPETLHQSKSPGPLKWPTRYSIGAAWSWAELHLGLKGEGEGGVVG